MDKRENVIYLSLGSNLGGRAENINKSKVLIEQNVGKIYSTSSIYETEGWGSNTLNSFYNLVLKVSTLLTPMELLKTTQQIEKIIGRTNKTGVEYENRLIDIDILFYENKIIKTEELSIPHPKLLYRRFVLEPLSEINSQCIHPEYKKSIEEYLQNLKDKSRCIKLS